MTPETLKEFLRIMEWTQKRLAHELGVSQGRMRRMLRGEAPIPRYIGLACLALSYAPRLDKEGAIDEGVLKK